MKQFTILVFKQFCGDFCLKGGLFMLGIVNVLEKPKALDRVKMFWKSRKLWISESSGYGECSN